MTLTLPGFAGMILTLGVAADANIVIFERDQGGVPRREVGAGGDRGRLRQGLRDHHRRERRHRDHGDHPVPVATAGVKGFALMLLIGTAMSLLTAVAATRAMLGLLAGFNWFDNPRLMGAEGEPPKWIRRDFVGRRNVWFAHLGAAFVAVSLGAIAIKGLNLGIDFRAARRSPSRRRSRSRSRTCASAGRDDRPGEARRSRAAARPRRATVHRVPIQHADARAGRADPADRRISSARSTPRSSVENVSASFGRQIAEGAIFAIFVSLLLIVVYISFRFQWKFAVPVLVALLHDVDHHRSGSTRCSAGR